MVAGHLMRAPVIALALAGALWSCSAPVVGLQALPVRLSLLRFLAHRRIDGVDSRQRAAALERAHEVSEATGTQYICALNSDMIPRDDFSRGFNFDERVRLTLTDKEPAGSLLGFNFDPPPKS